VSGGFLKRNFFERDPLACARGLIGRELLWDGSGGIVVETEAYSVNRDEACHTFMRPSAREFVASHPAGSAYVYLNYGMYWLLNVLIRGGSEDGFVLIRAIEPTSGIHSMRKRRGTPKPDTSLCSGPGKLAQALGITGAVHGLDLCGVPERGFRGGLSDARVIADVRVGISKAAHLPWRFLLAENRYVSVHAGRVKPVRRNVRTKPEYQ
jgi:DNA-3-methyladenine glycosylase